MKINILVNEFDVLSAEKFALLISHAMKETFKAIKQKNRLICLNVVFLTNDEMKELNNEKRRVNEVTDVLSFPLLNLKAGEKITKKKFKFDYNKKEKLIFIGDIFICFEKAEMQAKDFGHSIYREICYLVVHGLLHLLGFNHIEENDKKIMRALEEFVLTKINLKRESK